MKLIDQTPFFDPETGEISMLDRGKAIVKYGSGWIKEIEAQKQVLAVMNRIFDRNYTLLRNFLLPELGATFPFILVGPTGIFVMVVTPLVGMYQARGDQWGTLSGNLFREEKPNLLSRTERMARAVQVYLQRHGYLELTSVEAILLCSDTAMNVDSLRPIIRVVMRDALERFFVSITQAQVVLSQDAVYEVVQRLTTPPRPASTPPETSPSETAETPAFLSEEPAQVPIIEPVEPQPPVWDQQPPAPSTEAPLPAWEYHPEEVAPSEPQPAAGKPRRKLFTRGQWGFIIAMFIIWFLLVAVFLALVVRDQLFSIMSLLP